jgi:tetratricopeptide (TPR) repeat protein
MKFQILNFIIVFFLLARASSFAQDVDIVPYLKQVERGELDKVKTVFPELKQSYPNSPSVMFLEGILTENGQDAILIYNKIITVYPDSKYADAALYRIYSYYYALGLYETAASYMDRLKKNYPASPYIKIADRDIPSENVTETKGKIPDKEKKPDPINPSLPEKYSYTIQAGAFSKISNAESLRKDFQKSGFFSEIKEKVVGGTNFHIVYVGKFKNDDEAYSFLQIINREYKLEGRVIKID